VGFAHDCIDWRDDPGPAPYQEQTLANLVTYHRESVRGPHGLGKSFTAALAVLWFAITRDGDDWKVLTTASVWRQLDAYLWPEIHKWARRIRWDRLGRPAFTPQELLTLNIKLVTGQASAVASDDPGKIEGGHADHILYVLDEAKIIPPATWDAIEGALSTGDAYALAISTPGEPNGRFYEIQSRRAGTEDWHATHVTLEQAIEAGRINAHWAEQRRLQWGEDSAVYRNRVLGEFASSAQDSVIPLAWVEAANERWTALKQSGVVLPGFSCVGVDVARSGEDRTVLALRHGHVITELRVPEIRADTMHTTGLVAGILHRFGGYGVVDVIGIGAGVVDRLREEGHQVLAFNASEGTPIMDCHGELGFANKRSAAWWGLRDFLDPANGSQVALPPNDLLTGDLTAPRWRVLSGGRIQVESKDDIKKRLGRSTDHGDAVVQAFWVEPAVPAETVYTYEEDYRISPY